MFEYNNSGPGHIENATLVLCPLHSTLMADPRSSPGEEEIDCMSVIFEDTVDLEERLINTIQLTGRLITYEEPLESVVKEVLRLFWNGLGVVGIICVKPNIYSITVGDDQVASRILEGNPWFVKGYTFSVKPWRLYHSLDDIDADRVVYFI
ncbi:hypothetical protein ACFX13_022611 [Malus domestica]